MSRLRAARLAAGLTLEELARKSDVSVNTILTAEKGHRRSRHPTMRKLLKVLGIPFSEKGDYFHVGKD